MAAEKEFSSTIDSLFKGMDAFVTSKTVVGEPVRVDENTVIIPLIDVSCGMAAGAFRKDAKDNDAGGLSAKMSPSALLIVQNGITKLISIKHQDAVSKIIDIAPDIINRFTGKSKLDPDVKAAVDDMKEEKK